MLQERTLPHTSMSILLAGNWKYFMAIIAPHECGVEAGRIASLMDMIHSTVRDENICTLQHLRAIYC